MIKKLFGLILGALILAAPAFADETRYQFDENQPGGTIDLATWRSSLRGMNQMDMAALRPRAKRLLDGMEYGTDAVAAANYSGTGVTITKQAVSGSLVQEGSYSLKAVIDGTNNRSFGRSLSINLSPFQKMTVWTRSSATSSAIQFYVSDGTNSSYWNITTDASANTWKQDTLTLATPDANSGTAANLAAVTSYGYRLLDNGVTYYFDTIKAIAGMTVIVQGTDLGSYYRNVYLGSQPLAVDAQSSPTITAAVSNPRIDILTINSSGTLAWVTGTEAGSPTAPWSSVTTDKLPIAEVYMKTTMAKVVDYEDKDANPNEGYILRDVRPWMTLSDSPRKGADVASASTTTLGNDGNVFDITGTTTITSITAKPAGVCVYLQFDGALQVTDGSNLKLKGNFTTAAESTLILCSDGTNWIEHARSPTAATFLSLSDTPSSYSGQAYRLTRVNSGASALEFIALSSLAEYSIEEDTGNHKFRLVGDSSSPGNNKSYGTNSSGTRGWYYNSRIFNACETFTSSGTWTRPTGVDYVFVRIWGGGGGGLSSNIGSTRGGHGAGYSEGIIAVTSNVTVTIGSGGAAASSGGTSSFAGTTTISAGGATTSPGTASGGYYNQTGGTAYEGASQTTAGKGGDTFGFTGPMGNACESNGNAATLPGTGGSGVCGGVGGSAETGGAGAPGLAIVCY